MNYQDIPLNNLESVLQEYCNRFEALYKQKLQEDGRMATGDLINSVRLSIEVGEENISCILNVEDYYYYVENGRGAGRFPPIQKIIQWVEAKGIQPYPTSDGRLPTTPQLAYLIGRKIANEGYEGKPSLANTIEELNTIYTLKLQEALIDDFVTYMEGELKDVLESLM